MLKLGYLLALLLLIFSMLQFLSSGLCCVYDDFRNKCYKSSNEAKGLKSHCDAVLGKIYTGLSSSNVDGNFQYSVFPIVQEFLFCLSATRTLLHSSERIYTECFSSKSLNSKFLC